MTHQDVEASLLNIFKKQRAPPWVENSGYQKSQSPPGRSHVPRSQSIDTACVDIISEHYLSGLVASPLLSC